VKKVLLNKTLKKKLVGEVKCPRKEAMQFCMGLYMDMDI
jgi:hypothetical protein